MVGFVGRRLAWLVLVAVGMTLLTFVVTHLIPADPAKFAAGLDATAEQIEQTRRSLGLDKPLPEQYLIYLGNLARGDLGTSIITKRPVRDDLADYFPATLELTLWTMLAIAVVGVPLGVISATHRGGWIDLLTRVLATLWVALPVFWFGLVLQLVFYLRLGWLPAGERLDPGISLGRLTGLATLDAALQGNWRALLSAAHHLVLPVLTLALARVAVVARMTRAGMLEVLGADYVRTARAKGLREQSVIYRHALRNAALPVLTTLGTQMGFLLGGAILVEVIFQWPGMGRYAVSSITSVDFPAVMGVTLAAAALFVLVNLLVDLAYIVVDPRIAY
ncbi:MAG: ABC transporter permease [Chloroflexota bacterium]|nr:ABC transporter permease [Chloroflexota bacterium]